MSKFVPDISTRRWVVISPQRLGRPDNAKKKNYCPFCVGHESETPPEIIRYGGGEANKPGWKIRIVPNRFPITDIHEVIIHSNEHNKDIEKMQIKDIELVLNVYRQRYNFHKKQGQVLIFNNHSLLAGASLDHPHSQLVVIPHQINLDTLVREPINNLVEEDIYFNIYCPDFSQWPYEVWVAPKKEEKVFGDIDDKEITYLAKLMQTYLHRLDQIYNRRHIEDYQFGYNYYIYPKENWYLRIIPRFVNRAGFELGTGLSVNVVDPMEAALELRGIEKKMMRVLKKLKKY